LTVINKTESKNIKIEKSNRPVFYSNICLLVIVVVGLFGYIFLSNRIVASKYSVKQLGNEYGKKNADLELNESQINKDVDLNSLTAFAQKRGMVDAGETSSIFEESGVAVLDSSIQ
jgi:hypothetical protein